MKIQNPHSFRWSARIICAAGLVTLTFATGCATAEKYSLTHKLWGNGDMRKFSEPAPNPNLALFDAANHADVLVQYDALSEKHSAIQRRAYFLQVNQARTAAGKKPEFVKSELAAEMAPIPVFSTTDVVTNPPPVEMTFAVLARDGRAFTLYQPPESPKAFDLPVYCETSGTAMRAALTPLAVAGDTAMVGAVAGVVAFVLWVQGGGCVP